MNDMRELLSSALPAPQDEPQQRDVIDAAMDWGTRRRRRDWALSGAAALAVIAVGTGIAAMSGGSGSDVTAGGGPQPSSTHRSMASPTIPEGTWWTPYCETPGTLKGSLEHYCQLFNEQQNFSDTFAKGSVKYIQKALPAGFTVKATDKWVLILTGPDGTTNYMFPSAEPASTLDGHPLSCGTPAPAGCVQTSTAGGTVVVNSWPSGDPSAGYVADGQKNPRVDLTLGTSVTGGLNGMAPPTSAKPLLTTDQLVKVTTDPGFIAYATVQLRNLDLITHELQSMTPLAPSGSYVPITPTPLSSGFPSGFPSGGASSSWSAPSGSFSPPSGGWSSPSSPDTSGTTGFSQPPDSQSSGSGISSSESSPGAPSRSGSGS